MIPISWDCESERGSYRLVDAFERRAAVLSLQDQRCRFPISVSQPGLDSGNWVVVGGRGKKSAQRMTQPRLVMSDMYEAICVEDRFEPALSTDWMARRPTFAVRRTVPCA